MKTIAESSLIHISFIFITTVNSKTQRNRIKAPIFINKLLYKHHMHLSDRERVNNDDFHCVVNYSCINFTETIFKKLPTSSMPTLINLIKVKINQWFMKSLKYRGVFENDGWCYILVSLSSASDKLLWCALKMLRKWYPFAASQWTTWITWNAIYRCLLSYGDFMHLPIVHVEPSFKGIVHLP